MEGAILLAGGLVGFCLMVTCLFLNGIEGQLKRIADQQEEQ